MSRIGCRRSEGVGQWDGQPVGRGNRLTVLPAHRLTDFRLAGNTVEGGDEMVEDIAADDYFGADT